MPFPFEDPYDAVVQLEEMNIDALSLYTIPSLKGQWGSITPKKVTGGYISGWVDNNFIASREFFDIIGWKVEKLTNWNPNNKSNGVGSYLTKKASEEGLTLGHL